MAEKAPRQIPVKVADSDELITAGLAEVVAFSSVAEKAADLQPGNSAVTWDLSSLYVDSRPVSSRAVKDWLNVVYRLVHGTDHNETPTLVTEAATLCDLLELADAVQMTGGVIAAFESGLLDADLFITTQVVGQADIKIFVDGRGYNCRTLLTLSSQAPSFRFGMINSRSEINLDANQWAELQQQVACQTERLLYLAHKLKLPTHLSRIMGFITANLLRQPGPSNPIFSDDILSDSIYSDRVCGLLGFAGSDEVKQEWLKCKHQLKLTIGGEDSMLQVIEQPVPLASGAAAGLVNASTKVKFNEAFAGHKKGSTANITVSESRSRFSIYIGTVYYHLDMLVA